MRKIFLFIIKLYQYFISPLKSNCCRFVPTCSTYAYQSLKRFGIFNGSFLILQRIVRCNPFSNGGFDPVPEHKIKK